MPEIPDRLLDAMRQSVERMLPDDAKIAWNWLDGAPRAKDAIVDALQGLLALQSERKP